MGTFDQTMNQTRGAATSVADSLMDKTESLRNRVSDESSHLRDLAVEKADQARRYITSRGVSGMGRDVATAAREHPIYATATVLGLAYLTYRLFRTER